MELRPVNLPIGGDPGPSGLSWGCLAPHTMAAILVMAHGANNDMDYPLIAGLHELLARQGLVTVRFNFPYIEAGRKKPDPDDVLEGVLPAWYWKRGGTGGIQGSGTLPGGKSMGARLAAQLVAQEVGASGLVFMGYPLHPPAGPESLRISLSMCCPARPCSSKAAGTPSAAWTSWGRSWARCRCAPTCT